MRRSLLVGSLAVLAAAPAGCGSENSEKSQDAGLEARLFDTVADEVHSGPAGVFAVDGAELVPIDVESGDPTGETTDTETLNARIAIGSDAAWVAEPSAGNAFRVGLGTGTREPLRLPSRDIGDVAASERGAFVVARGALAHYASDGAAMQPIELPCEPGDLAASGDRVWGTCKRGLVLVDIQQGRAEAIDAGGEPKAIAVTGESAWALVGRRLVRFGASGEEVARAEAPAGTQSLAGEGENLWLLMTQDDGPQLVALHDATRGERTAGPVELPGSTDDVPATAAPALGPHQGSLWFALSFYGGPLGVVSPSDG